VIEGNRKAIQAVRGRDDLMMWAVLNPLLPDSFDQARELLQHPRCAGLKIHPEEHEYPVAEQGSRVFEFAAAHKAIVLSHSGEPNSMPGDVLSAAAAFPEVAVILAHLGCGWDGDPTHQVRAVQAAGLPNAYVDTSSAMNVTPGLLEWAVEQIGAERLLFGTDSPLYFAPMQRARIDHAELQEDDKRRILRDNARLLFNRMGVCSE
jgi:predicted TIM-barrel fold metal-dependent hydrolase